LRVDEDTAWSREAAGRFPELKELKQLARDRVAPAKALGHLDRS
jgi:selenoprotein W-related protein